MQGNSCEFINAIKIIKFNDVEKINIGQKIK